MKSYAGFAGAEVAEIYTQFAASVAKPNATCLRDIVDETSGAQHNRAKTAGNNS